MLARRITLTVLLTLFWTVGAAGKTSTKSKEAYIAGNYVEGSPVPTLCTADEARSQSRAMAAQTPGAFVLRGRGNSMLPLYRSGTLLVIQPVAFEKLSRGMSVVFQHEGRIITHVLVAKTGDGWRTTGLNNRRQDYIAVNDRNIRGVVIAAFTPLEGDIVTLR